MTSAFGREGGGGELAPWSQKGEAIPGMKKAPKPVSVHTSTLYSTDGAGVAKLLARWATVKAARG
jgi:hypothetical protein